MIWASKRNTISTKNNVLIYLLILLIIILSCVNGILFYTIKSQTYIKYEVNDNWKTILHISSFVNNGFFLKMEDRASGNFHREIHGATPGCTFTRAYWGAAPCISRLFSVFLAFLKYFWLSPKRVKIDDRLQSRRTYGGLYRWNL